MRRKFISLVSAVLVFSILLSSNSNAHIAADDANIQSITYDDIVLPLSVSGDTLTDGINDTARVRFIFVNFRSEPSLKFSSIKTQFFLWQRCKNFEVCRKLYLCAGY